MDYQRQIIPFEAFRGIVPLDVKKVIGDVASLRGPIAAFETMNACIKALWEFVPDEKALCTLNRWHEFLESTFVGTIKETIDYGNTSVSQGVAETKFASIQSQKTLLFANCGTGGMKRQVYARRNVAGGGEQTIVYSVFECKGGKSEPSPNAVRMGKYCPEFKNEEPDWAAVWNLHQERLDEAAAALEVDLDSRFIDYPMIVYTFITGPVRAIWEDASEEEKKVMEQNAEDFFSCESGTKLARKSGLQFVPWNGKSYFMSQKEEQEMEQLATYCMYMNLAKENQISADVVVGGTWGMGRGSTQMEGFMTRMGMNQETTIKVDLVAQFQAQLYTIAANMFAKWLTMPQNCKHVIALKSGFALLLQDKQNAWLLQQLQTAQKEEEEEEEGEDEEGDEGEEEEEVETIASMHVYDASMRLRNHIQEKLLEETTEILRGVVAQIQLAESKLAILRLQLKQ